VRLMVLVVVAFGGAVALADQTKDEKKDAPKKAPAQVKLAPDLAEILKLTNAERARKKLPALTADPILCKVAEKYSALMATKGKMEHQLDGQKAGPRIEAAGYQWKTVAENLASAIGKGP